MIHKKEYDDDLAKGEKIPMAEQTDLILSKTGNKNPVRKGDVLTYTLAVTNNGPGDAQQVTITDNVPVDVAETEYSLDGGAAWQVWKGFYALGTLASGATASIMIRGTVSKSDRGAIINTAIVRSATSDSDVTNNADTAETVSVSLPITCEEATNQIISSIAMEELGLSHILNTEGETLQYILSGASGLNPNIEQMLEVNKRVRKNLKMTARMQMFLSNKLSKVINACRRKKKGT